MKKRRMKFLRLIMSFALSLSMVAQLCMVVFAGDAWGGGNHAGGSGMGGNLTGNDNYAGYCGSGWRISLQDTGFPAGGDPSKSGSIFVNPENHLATARMAWSVIVAPGNLPNPTPNTTIEGLYVYGGSGYTYTPRRVLSINQLFPGINTAGFNPQPFPSFLPTNGGTITVPAPNMSMDWWNSTFKTYIGNTAESKLNALQTFMTLVGLDLKSFSSAQNVCVVAEPVVFFARNTASLGARIFALSWQDSYVAGSSLFLWLIAASEEASACYSRNTVLGYQGMYGNLVGLSGGNLRYTYSYNGYSIDAPGTGGSRNGYMVFGADSPSITDQGGKVGVHYTMVYRGTQTEAGKGFDVYNATNIVKSSDLSTIKVNTDNPGAANPGGLKSMTVAGENTAVPANPVVASDIVQAATGVGASNWSSQYSLVTTGIYRLELKNASDAPTTNITNAVKGAKPQISAINVGVSSFAVTGGNVNVGTKYTLALNGQPAEYIVPAAVSKLRDGNAGLFNLGYGKPVTGPCIFAGAPANVATNMSLFALKNCNFGKNDNKGLKGLTNEKYKAEGNSTMDVAVTVLAKKTPVKSYVALASIDRDTGVITKVGNAPVDYDIGQYGEIKIPDSMKKLCVYAIVPNNNGKYTLEADPTGIGVFNKVDKDSTSNDALKKVLEDYGVPVAQCGFISAKQTIRVGSATNTGTGYSVLVLMFTGNLTKKGNMTLMDYELNYVYPTMMLSGDFSTLLREPSYVKLTEVIKESLPCLKEKHHTWRKDEDKYVKTSSNYSGNIINRNKLLGSNKNILQHDRYGGVFATESALRGAGVVFSNSQVVKFTQAVDLVRGDFDNGVTVSSITAQTLPDAFRKDNIGIQAGNIPAGAKSASSVRSSNATVGGTLKDTFEWDVKFNDPRKLYQGILEKLSFACGITHSEEQADGSLKTWTCKLDGIERVQESEIAASYDGTRVKYVIDETAHKYRTASLPEAGNVTRRQPWAVSSDTASSITRLYRFSVVKDSGKTLGFYPEVIMRGYSTVGDSIVMDTAINTNGNRVITSSNVTAHNVYVMGEEKRRLKPSSMYNVVFKSSDSTLAHGQTRSDSAAVGTQGSSVSGGLPVVYAGGDISLSVVPDIYINMYGYALDLIEKADTSPIGRGSYTATVADDKAVKSLWGNDASYKPLADFNTWISDTIDKLAADTTLKVDGSGVNKTYNNFTASVGDVGNTDASPDGVYNIHIKEGIIQNDAGYQALVNQIKSDYVLDTYAQAQDLFKTSDIYKTIIDAVEDCNDSFNTSQSSNAIKSGRAHWYDEEVKTFVIRRYKKENILVKNIVVTDKVDYGAAPTQNSDVSSFSTTTGATAKWYLTLYFESLPEGFASGTAVYDPEVYSGLGNAYNAGTVPIKECYVDGADFVIPSMSTNDIID